MKKVLLSLLIVCMTQFTTSGLEVSLNIKGSFEEIYKVLECLKSLGFGTTTEEQMSEDPLKVHIFSSTSNKEKEVAIIPSVGFQEITIEPSIPYPGEEIKIFAKVVNESGEIDTVSASLMGTSISVDLRDDGENGDVAGGDGIWTGILPLPEDVKGNKIIVVSAYDPNGKLLQLKNPDGTLKPVMATMEFTIQTKENQ